MSVIKYSKELQSNDTQTSGSVSFFSLKDDGEEAIVRFMHDTTDSFDIFQTHTIRVNGKFKQINCLRNPSDPVEKCPFCRYNSTNPSSNEYKLSNCIIIHMLQYTKDQSGNIICSPVIWQRALSYAHKLSNFIDNYGPLSDIICKIIRRGKRGDLSTTYEIIPNLSKMVFPDNLYIKDDSAFKNFNSLGIAVLNKSYDDIEYFINNDEFPDVSQNKTSDNQASSVIGKDVSEMYNKLKQKYDQNFTKNNDGLDNSVRNLSYTSSNNDSFVPNDPWGDSVSGIQRPVRRL